MALAVLLVLCVLLNSAYGRKIRMCPENLPEQTHRLVLDGACYVFNETLSLVRKGCTGKMKDAHIETRTIRDRIYDELKILNWTDELLIGLHFRYRNRNNTIVIASEEGLKTRKIGREHKGRLFRHICQYRHMEFKCKGQLLTRKQNGTKVKQIHSTCYEYISIPEKYSVAKTVCKRQQGKLARFISNSQIKLARSGLKELHFESYKGVWISHIDVPHIKKEKKLLCDDIGYGFSESINTETLAFIPDNNTFHEVLKIILKLSWKDQLVKINGHYQLNQGDRLQVNTSLDGDRYSYVIQKCPNFTFLRLQTDSRNIECHANQKKYQIFQFKEKDSVNRCDVCQKKRRSLLRLAENPCCDPSRTRSCSGIRMNKKHPFICEYNSLSNVLPHS